MRIVVLNGPNLNLLGTRQPEIYGARTLADLDDACRLWAAGVEAEVETFQSNHEGAIIDRLHQAAEDADAVVINPGAFSHYSYAIRDAVEAIGIPTVEVHLSNIRAREPWRHHSVVSDACVATIVGRGAKGYRDAIWHAAWRRAWPARTFAYGADPLQVGDLRVPEGPGPHRVAVLFHGGFWRDTARRDLMDAAAVELARHGWATWNVDYRAGPGHDWTAPGADAVAAIDFLGSMDEAALDLDRVVAIGVEAGGHVAVATRASVAASTGVRPAAIAVLAALTDLEAAQAQDLGDGAVAAYLGGTPEELPGRYAAASPRAVVPVGVPLLVMHGDSDTVVPVEMSRTFAGLAADQGDEVVYHELENVNHDDLLRAGTLAFERVAAELDLLSRRTLATG